MKRLALFALLLAACAPDVYLPSVEIPDGTGWCCAIGGLETGYCSRCGPGDGRQYERQAWCVAYAMAVQPDPRNSAYGTVCFIDQASCEAVRAPAEPDVSGCVESN